MWVGYCRKERHWDLWFFCFDFQGITLPYFLGTGRGVSGRTWTGVSMMINHFFNVACGFVCKQYGRMRGQKREARRVEGLELEV